MNTWAPDTNALTNNHGIHHGPFDPNGSPGILDPSVASAYPNNIDVNSLQNPSLQHRVHNGTVRNPSPAFQNPSYQVNPVVPSKRPRPREDSIGTSPRQTPGSLNLSRSQTPHQAQYPPFQSNQHGGQPHPTPTPYQHLQRPGSSNATPSPTLQNQQFRAPGPQRVQTVSPNPFPPSQPSVGNHMSPPPDQVSRVSAPHNTAMAQPGQLSFMPTYNQGLGTNPGMTPAGMAGPLAAQPVPLTQNLQQRQAETQRLYAMRLQQQQTQLAAANLGGQQRPPATGFNSMPDPFAVQQTHGIPGASRPLQPPMAMSAARGQEQFLRTVGGIMQQHGVPFTPNPLVCGRPMNLTQLYAVVMKQRGSKRVTATNGWPAVAAAMGFPPAHYPTAPQEIQHTFEKNLALYEQIWMQKMQQQKLHGNQQPQTVGLPVNQQAAPTKTGAATASQELHNRQDYMQRMQQRNQSIPPQPPFEQPMTLHNTSSAPAPNGWPAAGDQAVNHQQAAFGHNGKGTSRQPEDTPPHEPQQVFPMPSPASIARGLQSPSSSKQDPRQAAEDEIEPPEGTAELGTHFHPKPRVLYENFGGYDVGTLSNLGEDISKVKPNVPNLEEMGVIDIQALGMSVQSGIHGEVRYALDHLVKLSHEARLQLELEKCEDLIDILVDCATDQVEVLADGQPHVSDHFSLLPYDEIARTCRAEVGSLRDIPEFGSQAYELERAADRLIAVTTIIRNLSFFETNHNLLSGTPVIRLISNTIHLLGTRRMLLRSHVNTQDFMKDVIIFLSNTSDKIELPGREDALNILHFLLAFAPSPPPRNLDSAAIRFAPYNPAIHRYLPPAVDSLAKLLARDEPNRAYYRQIFASTTASSSNISLGRELLTRAFGLAISVIPDRSQGLLTNQAEVRIVDARKPFMSQGMLAADILASLSPGPDSTLARAWLEAEDGWAPRLVRLVCLLTVERGTGAHPLPAPSQRQPQQPRGFDHESQGFGLVTHRALAMLRRLMEKGSSDEADEVPDWSGVDPLRGNLEKLDDPPQSVTNGDTTKSPAILSNLEDGEFFLGSESGGNQDDILEKLRGHHSLKRRRRLWAGMKADVLPKREMVLGALLTANIDAVALRQLCAFAGLDI